MPKLSRFSNKIARQVGAVRPKAVPAKIIRHAAMFHGDIPTTHRSSGIGEILNPPSSRAPTNFVVHEDWAEKPVARREISGVVYTPDGLAFQGRAVDLDLSTSRYMSVGQLLKRQALWNLETVNEGTIVAAEHPNTYGDWISEHMKSLALAGKIREPLLLPARFANRAYVGEGLTRLRIAWKIVDRPVLIRSATALLKRRPINLWTANEVQAYRARLGIASMQPQPRSLIYLSRSGVVSEQRQADRMYPSAEIARIVERAGGRVVLTGRTTSNEFRSLAAEAETVIADHGAAVFNLLEWNTRHVVEIAANNWWSSCFVFLSASLGADSHGVIAADQHPGDQLEAVIGKHLGRIGDYQAHRD